MIKPKIITKGKVILVQHGKAEVMIKISNGMHCSIYPAMTEKELKKYGDKDSFCFKSVWSKDKLQLWREISSAIRVAVDIAEQEMDKQEWSEQQATVKAK